jgi:hypothetical protein
MLEVLTSTYFISSVQHHAGNLDVGNAGNMDRQHQSSSIARSFNAHTNIFILFNKSFLEILYIIFWENLNKMFKKAIW